MSTNNSDQTDRSKPVQEKNSRQGFVLLLETFLLLSLALLVLGDILVPYMEIWRSGAPVPEAEALDPTFWHRQIDFGLAISSAALITAYIFLRFRHRRIEAHLRESERRYRQIFDVAPLPMWVSDVDDPRILAVNEAAVRKYGYTREQLLSMSAIDLQHEADREHVQHQLSQRNPEQSQNFRRRHVTRDGRLVHAEINAQPFEFDGRPARLVIALDVTEREVAHRLLLDSEARFRAMFEQAAVGISIRELSERPRYIRANQRLCDILGYTEAELQQLSSLDLTFEADIEESRRLNVQMRTGAAGHIVRTVRMRRKDGRIIWVKRAVSRIDPEGKVGPLSYLVSMVEDITEQHEQQKQLQDSRRRVELALESAHGAMFDWDIGSGAVYLSDHWKRILGEGRGESQTTSMVLAQLAHAEDYPKLYADAIAMLKGGAPMCTELRVAGVNGAWVWVESRGSVTARDDNGRATRVLGTIVDVTQRKLAEKALGERDARLREQAREILRLNADLEQRVAERTSELMALNQEMESFSYSISHDLRAPLRAIEGFSQIFLEEYAGKLDTAACGYLERIRAGSLRMSMLIDDLLELSRVTRRELMLQSCDLTGLIHELLRDLQAAEPGRRVQADIAPDMSVWADRGLLRIAVENLLRNAWKFTGMREEALIRAGCRVEENGEVTCFIADNGVGFDMAYANKLFKAFQRLHSTTEFEGTGIGLALVQRVIRRHGGQVRAEAVPDQGATFYFSLQRKPQAANPAEKITAAA